MLFQINRKQKQINCLKMDKCFNWLQYNEVLLLYLFLNLTIPINLFSFDDFVNIFVLYSKSETFVLEQLSLAHTHKGT